MSTAAAEHAPPVARRDNQFGPASTGKIAMWIFLVSDALSFGGLLLGYGILRGYHDNWPNPSKYLGINFTAGMTFLLIVSSVTMVLALAAAHEKNLKQQKLFLALTMLGGILFLCGQVYEYHHLITGQHMGLSGMDLAVREGVPPAFSSTFFIITSFHGCHVFTGVCYLGVMLVKSMRGTATTNGIEIAGLFWHFVDLIWILVFTFVYLIP
jgi:heme/copper-type cytochrome/quinol oxidase subunit 3